jgi:formyltetrahydrofolate deformylase
MKPATARLLIWCPDRTGIIAAATGFLAECAANILEADQHADPDDGAFCMRLEFETAGMNVSAEDFPARFQPLADRYHMDWRIAYSTRRKRAAILVSKEDHCLHDLLLRQRCGEIDIDLPIIIGNHADLAETARGYGVAFHTLPVSAKTKAEQERKMLALLEAHDVELVILARYMQILTAQVINRYPGRIINIHHSFLPAFAGGRPYHQAYERGVKVVGATAHYVTEELDAGPIIAQATAPINHRDSIDDLMRKGRDLERTVLASAVRLHVEDKILVHQNRTIVFE